MEIKFSQLYITFFKEICITIFVKDMYTIDLPQLTKQVLLFKFHIQTILIHKIRVWRQ